MKKASLSLSINAIVVLILAIVIMAFALPFIQKMFKSTTAEFEALTGEEPPAAVANGANPVTLSRNNLIMNLGDKKALKASVFNAEGLLYTGNIFDPNQLGCNGVISIYKQSQPTIKQNEAEEVILIISADKVGIDICKFKPDNRLTKESISIPVTVR